MYSHSPLRTVSRSYTLVSKLGASTSTVSCQVAYRSLRLRLSFSQPRRSPRSNRAGRFHPPLFFSVTVIGMFAGWTRLRKLSYIWWGLELAFVAVAVVLITVSTVWRDQDNPRLDQHALRRITIKTEFLNSKSLTCPVVQLDMVQTALRRGTR